jgi:hypothetical protein
MFREMAIDARRIARAVARERRRRRSAGAATRPDSGETAATAAA